MPKKVTAVPAAEKVSILIPKDPQNPDIDAVHFQRDGVDVYVPFGETVEVPKWVKESAIHSGYIKK